MPAGLPGLWLASAADEADWALGLEVLQPIMFGGSWGDRGYGEEGEAEGNEI